MRKLFRVWMIVALIMGLTASSVRADPALPLPRVPICGDQDGSEIPLVFQCQALSHSADVLMYQVPGNEPVNLRFDFVFREAGYNNELGFFIVDDSLGRVGDLDPESPEYLERVFQNAHTIFPSGSHAGTQDVEIQLNGGELLVFYIIQNGTLEQFLASNPQNEVSGSPLAFFSLDRLNPDGVDHFVGFENTSEGYTQFGFEDLTGGGDLDYDDIVYNIYMMLCRTYLPIIQR
jgi:hypothetical protein